LGWGYDITLTSGQIHLHNDFGNIYYHDETAWAIDPTNNYANAIEFNTFTIANNWGWTNGAYTIENLEAGLTFEVWAGVGLNDINHKGMKVGIMTVKLSGTLLTITYDMDGYNELYNMQFYIGKDKLPKDKKGNYIANPGQFPIKRSFEPTGNYTLTIDVKKYLNGVGPYYIAAHADTRLYEEFTD